MTIKQQIVTFLQNHPEGIDDDELARVLDLSARQQVNSRCRELAKEGLIIRRQKEGKIHNYWAGNDKAPVTSIDNKQIDNSPKSTDWFWEGNVQATVVDYLINQDYRIKSMADMEW